MLPRWIEKRISVEPSGCWRWTGTVAWNGYGSFRGTAASRIAHRAVYVELVGPVPVGLDLDHLCRNRLCVNPAHLEPVTRSENLSRSPLVGKHGLARTHCVHGHEYTEKTTLRRRDGRRQCRPCMSEASRRFRARLVPATDN